MPLLWKGAASLLCQSWQSQQSDAPHLLTKLEDLRLLWVPVDNRLVLDLASPISVPEGVESFLKIRVGGAHARNHHGLAVSTKGICHGRGTKAVPEAEA